MKYDGAPWFKMAGINEEDDMLSNARNAGSRPLRGEGDLNDQGLLIGE